MIKKLYNFFKKWDYKIKFIMVGGLNTLVGMGSYWLILLMFGINITQNNSGIVMPVIVATVISQILGLINSYFWNKYFTFESKKKSKKEILKFIVVYLVAFAVDYMLKFVLRTTANLNEIFIAIITTITTMIISFVGQKLFVFRLKKEEVKTEENKDVKVETEPSLNNEIDTNKKENE